MHLHDLVRQRWAETGLGERDDPRLRQFLDDVDAAAPGGEPPSLAPLLAPGNDDLFAEAIPPLLATPDKLLRVVVIRQLDPAHPQALATLRDFVRRADPVADRAELNAVLARVAGKLDDEFAARPQLRALIHPPPQARRMSTQTVPPPAARKHRHRR